MDAQFVETQLAAESWEPEQLLRWSFDHFHPHLAIASGFGAEGMVLIDLAMRIRRDVKIFTLDTDFLFAETYILIGRVQERYGTTIELVRPALSPEQQARDFGPALWKSNPDECCRLRKIEPLRKKLAGLRAWVTAIRRDQTPTRAHARKLDWDQNFGLVKINPLADWSNARVWSYIREHNLPYNPLHDRNYPSIGCTHCTRAVQPGEAPRAGRWAGFAKTECGLHQPLSEGAPESASAD